MRLKNKVAIITGAASGMGEAMAYLFAAEGAKVVATDLQTEKLNSIVSKIKEQGGDVIGITHNVGDRKTWMDVVIPETIKAFGKIDVLINNAGISVPTPY